MTHFRVFSKSVSRATNFEAPQENNANAFTGPKIQNNKGPCVIPLWSPQALDTEQVLCTPVMDGKEQQATPFYRYRI